MGADIVILATCEIDGEQVEVFVHVHDLDAFVHADHTANLFVSDSQGNQWGQAKASLSFVEIVRDGQ